MKLIPANEEISHLKVAEALLENGVTMIHLLRNRPGVVVPESCNTNVVHLNFSYRYMIPDCCVDERGIRASLSFSGVPFFCDIPWEAVCGISSQITDEFFVWINVFQIDEIQQFLPPEFLKNLDELKDVSILEEMPELKPYAFDNRSDEAKDDEDDQEEEDDDDDVPPGGYTPLHFV